MYLSCWIFVAINSTTCDVYSKSKSTHLSSVCCRNSFRPSNLHTSRCVSYVSWLPMNVQLSARRGRLVEYEYYINDEIRADEIEKEWLKLSKRWNRPWSIISYVLYMRSGERCSKIFVKMCFFLGLTHIWSVDIWCVHILWGEPPGSWWAAGDRRGCWGSGPACSHNWPRVLCREQKDLRHSFAMCCCFPACPISFVGKQ